MRLPHPKKMGKNDNTRRKKRQGQQIAPTKSKKKWKKCRLQTKNTLGSSRIILFPNWIMRKNDACSRWPTIPKMDMVKTTISGENHAKCAGHGWRRVAKCACRRKKQQRQLKEPTISKFDNAKKRRLQSMAYHSQDGYGKNDAFRGEFAR